MGADVVRRSKFGFGCAFVDSGQAPSALDARTVVAALAVFTVAAVVAGSTVYAIAAVVAGLTTCAVGAWEESGTEKVTGSFEEPDAQLLQEMQFLHPRQLTQLSLPSLSGMVVVGPP